MVHDIVDDNILYIYTVYTVLLDVITKYVYEYVNKLCKNTFWFLQYIEIPIPENVCQYQDWKDVKEYVWMGNSCPLW